MQTATGSYWTFANHDENRTAAAWLYAQFITTFKKTLLVV
jgi:uncharacterized protein (DUF427 family)